MPPQLHPNTEGSPALGPSDSPAHLSDNSSSHHTSFAQSPLYGHSPCGMHQFAKFLANSTLKRWDCSPSSSLDHHLWQEDSNADCQEVETGSDHSSTQGAHEKMSGLIPEAGPSSEQLRAGNWQVLLQAHLGPLLTLMTEQLQRACRAQRIKPHWTLNCLEKIWKTLT